jgi:diguanylate cyclase (GGDEF)-like protein
MGIAPDMTMPESLVKGALKTAQWAVVLSFLATALVTAALVTERIMFERAFSTAADREREATEVSNVIILEDMRATWFATMAAATGDLAWIGRYEANFEVIFDAIDRALPLAPPEVGERFAQETQVANENLATLELSAFELIKAGRTEEAEAILQGEDYARNKDILSLGIDNFLTGLKSASAEIVDGVQRRASWFLIAVLMAAFTGFSILGVVLRRTLQASLVGFGHAEQRLVHFAMTDELTGLPNRRTFMTRVDAMIEKSFVETKTGTGVALIDIDHFKRVNDTLGHMAGDALIQQVTQRLKGSLPERALIARFGGDEIAVAYPCATIEDMRAIVDDAAADFREGFDLDGQMVFVTFSAGIAFSPLHSDEALVLLRLADIALYQAKADGRSRSRMFDPTLDIRMRESIAVEADLRDAVGNDELVLHYQPIMSSNGLSITGLEALVRWNHPVRGMVSPGVFIPIAEQSGLIIEIGEWVLRQAFRDAARWPTLMVAVNLSPRQFRHPDFIDVMRKLVAETGVDPTRIELEVTESLMLEDSERVSQALLALHALGFVIALDDFGTGYSSLSYLRRYPFQKIKIDQSFIRSIDTSTESGEIIRSIVGLRRALGMIVTAEGVETTAQHRFLEAAGCQQMQGYLFSRPIAVSGIVALVWPVPDQAQARSA